MHRSRGLRAVALAAALALSVSVASRVSSSGSATAAVSGFGGSGIAHPLDIARGPDGALWFTNAAESSIGRITTSGAVTSFTDSGIAGPQHITVGPDGALWFTNHVSNSIGRITTSGTVTEHTDPSVMAPQDITVGADGALWFTNAYNNSIGRISTSGDVTNFTGPGIAFPSGIAAGPDGALWFTNVSSDSIGRITTAGGVTYFANPRIQAPHSITAGPDGALWFTNSGKNSIGRITTSGRVTGFTDPSIARPEGIVPGPDGALWFANTGSSSLGRITASGAITDYPAPGASATFNIAVGADSALWFTETMANGSGSIGRFTMPTGTSTCTGAQYCLTAGQVTSSASSPAAAAVATGKPDAASGSMKLGYALGTLRCPTVPAGSNAVGKLTTTGFSAKAQLRIRVTLRQSTATSAAKVCLKAAVPFPSGTSTTSGSHGGTGMLVSCTKTKNVAPCLVSSGPVGTSLVVVFLVKGGASSFSVQWPAGSRQSWLSKFGPGTVGVQYSAQLRARGGTAPYHWKVSSGKLPKGLTLKSASGALTGKPKVAGNFAFAIRATDAARPAQATKPASITLAVNPKGA